VGSVSKIPRKRRFSINAPVGLSSRKSVAAASMRSKGTGIGNSIPTTSRGER